MSQSEEDAGVPRSKEQVEAQLEMARERLRRVGEFAWTLPATQRDDLRLILGPEFEPK